MKKVLAFGLLFCAALSATGCGPATEEDAEETAVPVEVYEARKGTITESIIYVGDIRGRKQVEVYPKVSGKLIAYAVEDGDAVRKDDRIALIDRDVTGYDFESAPVKSPISGVVLRTYLDRGDSVKPEDPVAVIADTGEVLVRIDVSEKDYPAVAKGQPAEVSVDAYPGRKFTGELTRLSRIIDPMSRTALGEVSIPNPEGELVPGMFARLELVTGEREALLLLRDAVIRRAGTASHYSFVAEEGAVRRVRVELGMVYGKYREVVSGLHEGDLAVVSGQGILDTGTPVEVVKTVEQ